jgi:hypothetical protein
MFKFTFHDDIYTEKNAAGVTCFRISAGSDFEKWTRQNSAEYTGDFVAGCLLDNFVMVTPRGYAAFYENFVNEWTSDYYVEFQPGAAQDVFKKWYDFETENAEE